MQSGGRVQCWGGNSDGALGTGDTNNVCSPTEAFVMTDAVSVTAGFSVTCAIAPGGDLFCWGNNGYGLLGRDELFSISSPPSVPVNISAPVAGIYVASTHACAVTAAGSVKCWGFNSHGQLGLASLAIGAYALSPGTDVPVGSLVSALALGWYHTCAIVVPSGGIRCWGDNTQFQLGYGDDRSRLVPSVINIPMQGVAVQISAGSFTTCAILTTGTLTCWGANAYGMVPFAWLVPGACGRGVPKVWTH